VPQATIRTSVWSGSRSSLQAKLREKSVMSSISLHCSLSRVQLGSVEHVRGASCASKRHPQLRTRDTFMPHRLRVSASTTLSPDSRHKLLERRSAITSTCTARTSLGETLGSERRHCEPDLQRYAVLLPY
jgi:hypothetical protein